MIGPHERQARARPLYRRHPDRQSFRSQSRAPPAMLARADLIAVEDSRVTAKLLRHIGVKRPMTPYHDHNADRVRPGLIARMASEAVALVSDAGTPLISDPGYKLVRDARAAGVNDRHHPRPQRGDRGADPGRACRPTASPSSASCPPRPARARRRSPRRRRSGARSSSTKAARASPPRLARAARRPRRPRGGGGARDQQEVRGDGDRHARPSSPPAMPTRRPRARSSSSSARPARPSRPARRISTRRCARRWPASPPPAPPPRSPPGSACRSAPGLRARAAAQMKRQRAERGGRRAERLAAWWLRLKGWHILAMRARTPVGEVDLVARRGRIARLHRGQGAGQRGARPISRSTIIACAGSSRPPRRSPPYRPRR